MPPGAAERAARTRAKGGSLQRPASPTAATVRVGAPPPPLLGLLLASVLSTTLGAMGASPRDPIAACAPQSISGSKRPRSGGGPPLPPPPPGPAAEVATRAPTPTASPCLARAARSPAARPAARRSDGALAPAPPPSSMLLAPRTAAFFDAAFTGGRGRWPRRGWLSGPPLVSASAPDASAAAAAAAIPLGRSPAPPRRLCAPSHSPARPAALGQAAPLPRGGAPGPTSSHLHSPPPHRLPASAPSLAPSPRVPCARACRRARTRRRLLPPAKSAPRPGARPRATVGAPQVRPGMRPEFSGDTASESVTSCDPRTAGMLPS